MSRAKGRSLRRQTMLLVTISIITLLALMSLYLGWFSQVSRQRAVRYAQDNLAQVSGQLEGTFENVRNITFNLSFNQQIQEYLTTGSQEKKFIELYPMISQMLEFILISNNDIYDILIYGADGTLALSRQRPHSLDLAAQYAPHAAMAKNVEPQALPTVMLGNFVFFPYTQTIYGVFGHSFMQRIGTCYVLCDGNAIQRFVEGITITENAQFFIVDDSDTVIASNRPAQVGAMFDAQLYGHAADAQSEIMADGERYIVQFQHINGWTAFSLIPVKSLMSDFQRVLWLGLLIGILAASFLLLASSKIGREITRSVKGLVDFFQAATGEEAQRHIGIGGPTEIQVIQSGLNDMLDRKEEITGRLLHTQADLYEAQLLQRQTQYTALQRQINPHFLFNTLHCISAIGAVRGVPEIVQISNAMANIFRYCIKGTDIVSVREELACVQDYLSIIHLRYQGKIEGTVDVDEALYALRMPKMILQPIVENAVFHGLEPKLGGGRIRITGRLEAEGTVAFTIEDDGKGMDAETLARLNQTMADPETARQDAARSGIGLYNILRRIRFVFGETATVHITATENEGSCVRLSLPLAEAISDTSPPKTEVSP